MPRLFTRRIRKAGLPPGSVSSSDAAPTPQKTRICLIQYTEDQFIEKNDLSLQEALDCCHNSMMTWIQVYGVTDPNVIVSIGKHFSFHPLVIEDIFNTGQRSKIDIYPKQLFVVVRSLQYTEDNHHLQDEQISIVFGGNYLISFTEGHKDIFEPIRERLRLGSNLIRKQGSDYLAYALIDTIVDYYFVVLEKVDTSLDQLEEELLNHPQKHTLEKIQHAKREMILLRKAIWPIRDVVNRFLKLEDPHVTPATLIYMHDIYDHIVQTIDVIEGFRDVVSGMMDIYLSNINIRMNEIMKVLTIVSTIFVPLTFICSVYGMNFDYMPELRYHYGYATVLVVMAFIASGMLFFFHKKKWI